MSNPTLMFFMEQIESVETNIDAIEHRISSLVDEESDSLLEREILLREIQRQYKNLLASLKEAAQTVKTDW